MIIKYDKKLDILYIKNENEPVKSSLRIGPYIFDFSFNKKVIGVEILNTSDTFGKILNLDKTAFEHVEKAKIRNIMKPDVMMVAMTLIINKKEYNPVLNVPLKTESSKKGAVFL